ncbi:NAD-dependent epimerase/dehydratase family protein [Streptomyces sp. NPDC001933]|uniref:NAD-dependent epimerase/dehydratase family protein n=1 Tax=Streptomyces sp. NPDC001933 TaxID=3364626 RepID=UPI0036CC462A
MKVLLTGSGGVVGSEVADLLARAGESVEVTAVTRRPSRPGETRWVLGAEPPPAELREQHWDAVIHSAASTRWTMTEAEATEANIRTTEAVLELADGETHVVHVSTAYVEGQDAKPLPSAFGRHRNGYEWSKAECEDLVRAAHTGPLTIVRPPLVFGRRTDGAISRFSGPYTMVQALVSGLAPAVVGDPDGFVEIAPVDQVAEVIAAAALGAAPGTPAVEVIAAGDGCLRLSEMIGVICRTLNDWREEEGITPVAYPPFITSRRWHRFFLPLAEQHLSEVQFRAVELLGMFEGYTSMPEPFRPTRRVADPSELLARSVRWWAQAKPRHAKRLPRQWSLIPV